MPLLDLFHGKWVHVPRVRVLSAHISSLLPHSARVLDVGCGDGLLSKLIIDHMPDLSIQGVDVKVRSETHIPVKEFDGRRIDLPDNSCDVVMFIDVLHHADDPEALLKEAARVSSQYVIIKDHILEGLMASRTLSFMDWVSNARHGVVLAYRYWTREQWQGMFQRQSLEVEQWIDHLGLYPKWARWIFERKLHFLARLKSNDQV